MTGSPVTGSPVSRFNASERALQYGYRGSSNGLLLVSIRLPIVSEDPPVDPIACWIFW